MGSKILPHALVSLPKAPSPHSPKLVFAFSSSSLPPSSFSSSRLVISRVSPSRFGSTVLTPVVRRSRVSTVVSVKSSSDEEETVENETVEEESGVSDVGAEAKPLRKPIIKLGDIMGILNKRAVEAAEKERPVPDIRTGDVVEIKLEVPENRRRMSIYKGIVMSRQNAGIHTTIRIRRIIAGIGVEIVFPLYSPNIKEIKVVKHRKVRRARLYYLRDKLPRLSTFK